MHEDEDFHKRPEPLRVRLAEEDEQSLAARKVDGQRLQRGGDGCLAVASETRAFACGEARSKIKAVFYYECSSL